MPTRVIKELEQKRSEWRKNQPFVSHVIFLYLENNIKKLSLFRNLFSSMNFHDQCHQTILTVLKQDPHTHR